MTKAVQEFVDLLHKERNKDPRPIVGARVPGDFFRRLNQETYDALSEEQKKSFGPNHWVRKLFGVTLYIGIVDSVQFDH